jgi:NRAMP (natural resistance-associated macrophage protein)-like metal ion transporter
VSRPPDRFRVIALFRELGPGLITGAADDDPSGIATYSQAGAQYGYGLLWTMVLTYPLMVAVQLISAHVGRVTGHGLAKNMADVMPRSIVTVLVALVFLANTINIGADIAAMGAAAQLVVGKGEHAFTVAFAAISLVLQVFVPYRRYARALKGLTLVLLAYVALLFVIHVDWPTALKALVWPQRLPTSSIVTIVAVFGTTISPYLFFWQGAQEVEEMSSLPGEKPLIEAPEQAPAAYKRMRWDTLFGMAVSNVVALAIIISTAATLHVAGKTNIATAADAASALRPLGGPFASLLFSMGIVGTGLLAVPILAGSAGYAVAETLAWKSGLEQKPRNAIGFYGVIAAATLLGIGIDWSALDPIKALFWSAVVNGVVAVPIMVALMFVSSMKSQMGQFRNGRFLQFFGWLATVVMGLAAASMIVWH